MKLMSRIILTMFFIPHGKGKLTYKIGDEVIEEYEGEFEVGQYHGKGQDDKGRCRL